MDSTVTLPWVGVIAIFLLGAIVGWLAAGKLGTRVSVKVGSGPLVDSDLSKGLHVRVAKSRTVLLKCQCGATWQFREGIGPFPPGTEPIPTGDSYTCKKCGRSIDLTQERQLEAEAMRSLYRGDVNKPGI
jgi:hypothetical protein